MLREYSRTNGSQKDIQELSELLIAGLQEIQKSVNRTAAAWEKRDYWLKADAFRRQWCWVEDMLAVMTKALQAGDRPSLQVQILELKRRMETSSSSRSPKRRS
jgi:hypothetical protein